MLVCLLLNATTQAADLQVTVSGFESTTGSVFVSVYDNKKDWLSKNVVAKQQLVLADALQDDALTFTLRLVPGEYAVSLFHDENDNGKLDARRPIPIPKEPIGLSNNKRPRFGPPKYKHAKFQLLDEPMQLSIELQ